MPLKTPALIIFLHLFLWVWSHGSELQTFENCQLIETSWADGDSFRVRIGEDKTHTIRLYGADTLETQVNDSTLARRLRAQRRYFGISNYGGSPTESIALAKQLGEAARQEVVRLLEEPFTVHTAFADGRGSARHKRIYAFVTTHEGKDLATELVRRGLARAFGLYRSTPDGQHREEYRASLQDAELVAARRAVGIWQYTDWDALQGERRAQRVDEVEEAIAMGRVILDGPVNLNTAAVEELGALPGIGPVLADRIVEARPFDKPEDLLKVSGIGRTTLERISDQIEF